MKPSNPTSQPETPSSEDTLSTQNEGSARTSVKGLASDAKRSAGNMLNQAKESASSMAREQKQSAAEHIGRYGTALRDSARSVEQEDPNVAYFANRAAESIEKVADYIRSTDLEGLRRDAEDLARRNPAWFMGGMLVAGLVVGGLLKATAATMREDEISNPGDVALNEVESLESPDVVASRTDSNL